MSEKYLEKQNKINNNKIIGEEEAEEIEAVYSSDWSSEYDQLLELLLETHNFDFTSVTTEINKIFKEIAFNMKKK